MDLAQIMVQDAIEDTDLSKAQQALQEHKVETQKRAFWLSYTFGLLVGAEGVGTFSSILAIDYADDVTGHEQLLRGMDIT